jgi:hypothetical protein
LNVSYEVDTSRIIKELQRRIRVSEKQTTSGGNKCPPCKLLGPPNLSTAMLSGDFYMCTQDGCLNKHNHFFVGLLHHRLPSDELNTDIVHRRPKSVSTETPITFLPEYRCSTDSTEMAPSNLDDTQGADRQQLDEAVRVMALEEDWIDWTGNLDTTGLISSVLDRRLHASGMLWAHIIHMVI